jgi:hypothetical protein
VRFRSANQQRDEVQRVAAGPPFVRISAAGIAAAVGYFVGMAG